MPEFPEDGSLLQALRDEQIPSSTLDVAEFVASGRRKVRARNWIGAATITAVLIAAIPLVLTKARSPNAPPDRLPLATPSEAVKVPTACTAELLPVPAGYEWAKTTGGDPSGRYLTGFATKVGESVPVVWENGTIMTLPVLPGSHAIVTINERGVVAGSSPDGPWVYRDGKLTTLPQPPGGAAYRPVAINSKGQIAGTGPLVVKGQTGYPPLIWGADGSIEAVANRSFWARDIDDDGTVIGQENIREFPGDLHGLIWRPGTDVTDLPTPPGVRSASAMSIRDGWVGGYVPYSMPSNEPLQPIVFHLGTNETVALPAEVALTDPIDPIEEVNSHGWVAVRLTGSAQVGLLADGKLLPLPHPSGIGDKYRLTITSLSDDGRALGGWARHSGTDRTTAVRWLCQ